MGETLGSGNDAQHEPNQDLARLVVIRTFWLIKPPLLELFEQPDPPEKLDQYRQPAKGRHRPQGVTDFDLSATKKRLKFLANRSVPAPEKNV